MNHNYSLKDRKRNHWHILVFVYLLVFAPLALIATTANNTIISSSGCNISASATNIVCSDNDTPLNPADDFFTFELLVQGNEQTTTWTTESSSGNYGEVQVQGPFLISDGVVELSIVDAANETCTTSLEVPPPTACSEACMLSANVVSVDCDEMDTPYDSSDDVFYFTVEVNNLNEGNAWTTDQGLAGNYGEIVVSQAHNYADGAFELLIRDVDIPECYTTVNVEPPSPNVYCPEDTDLMTAAGSIQVISGYLGDTADSLVTEVPCFVGLHSTPIIAGDRFMEPVDIRTPSDSTGATQVYTFYLFANLDGPTVVVDEDGVGALFNGYFSSYADPCCFNINYPDTTANDTDLTIENPFVDTTGLFNQEMNLVQRFTHTLKNNQDFSLVTSTFAAEQSGAYAWVVVSETQDSLVVNSNNVSSQFYEDQSVTYDLTFLHIPWLMGHAAESQLYVGAPLLEPYCGVDTLSIADELLFADSCSDASINRTYYVNYGDQIDSCIQELGIRRPRYDDVVLPPATLTFECDDDYNVNSQGYPDVDETGYPLIQIGPEYVPMYDTVNYFQLAVSYKDKPQEDTMGLDLSLIREWTITDICNGDTIYVIPQRIKVGDFLPPTIRCPLGEDCSCPNVAADVMAFDVSPGQCTANIELPAPIIGGFCDTSRIAEWTVLTELISATDSLVLDSIYSQDDRNVAGLERGDYILRYSMENAQGDRVEESCQLKVIDKQVPTALCRSAQTVLLSEIENTRIYADDIDLGSYDNCALPIMEVRRYYSENNLSCNDSITASGYGDWGAYVDFSCCDQGDAYLLELRVMDLDSNVNACTSLIEVIDDLAPSLSGLEQSIELSCADLPFGFDPTDSLQLVALFGYPHIEDECLDVSWELAAELTWNDCELASIRRQFFARDEAGNTNELAYEQWVNISAENTYGIRFQADRVVSCIGDVALPSFRSGACAVFDITYEDQELTAPTAVCQRIERTYHIINTCDYDGFSDPLVIARDENCNEQEGEQAVWLVVEGGQAYVDADSLVNNAFPPMGSQGTDCNGQSNPAGYWRAVENTGYWVYTQIIDVVDVNAPQLVYEQPAPYCSIDEACTAPVDFSVSVALDCPQERHELELWWDENADGTLDQDLTNTAMLTANGIHYRVTGDFPLGDHIFSFIIKDECDNETREDIHFSTVDCYIAPLVCKTGMQVQLSPIVPAVDLNGDDILDEGAYISSAALLVEDMLQDCSNNYSFSVVKTNDTLSFDQANLILTCEDRYTAQRYVIVQDNAYNPYAVQPDGSIGGPNYTSCLIEISVQDEQEVCSACVAEEMEIEGLIQALNGDPLSGVEVQLFENDDPQEQALTVNDGKYEFNDLNLSSNFKVQPYKNDDTPNGVTTLDLIILQRHLLLIDEITDPYTLLAADVNKSGTVTTLDLLFIQQLLLEHIETFPNNTSWRFIPSAYPLTDISADIPDAYHYYNLISCQFAQNFKAIKVGDLNASATLDGSGGLVETVEDRTNWLIYTDEQYLHKGNTYEVDIRVSDIALVAGMDLNLFFDPSLVEVQGVESTLIQESQLRLDQIKEGKLSAIYLDDQTEKNNGQLLRCKLIAKENTSLSAVLQLQKETQKQFLYDQNLKKYKLKLEFQNNKAQRLVLYGNTPDPFVHQTQLEFFLPIAATYTVELRDAKGSLLFTLKRNADKGMQNVLISGENLPKGILYCSVLFKGNIYTDEIIKM